MKLVTKLGIRVFELRFLGAKGKLKKKVLGELKCRGRERVHFNTATDW